MGAIASRSSSKEGRRGRRGRTGRKESGPKEREPQQEFAPSMAAVSTTGRNGSKANGHSSSADLLERLTRVTSGKHRIVTCYLKLEPRDRSRGKYLIKVKNRVKSALQALPRLGLDRDIADEVTRDLNRVQEFLRNPGNLPHTQGLAIFACEGIGLFEMVPLPVVHRSRLSVD